MFVFNNYNSQASLKNVYRLGLIEKLNLSNSYGRPEILGSRVFVVLKSLENFDSSRLVASAFALRLISGQRPYVARFGLFQTFKEKDYDVLVQVSVRKVDSCKFLSFLAYKVVPFVSKSDFNISYSFSSLGVVAFFTISDLSFIRFVETHSAFFRWRDVLNVQIYVKASSPVEASLLLDFIKLKQ